MNERRGKRRLDFSLQAYFLDGKVFVSKMEDASTQNSTQNSTLCIIYQCLCETMSMSVGNRGEGVETSYDSATVLVFWVC